jgi:DNA polymerase sigma
MQASAAMHSSPSSAEAYLGELLVSIDRHSQQAWRVQGALLTTLDLACRRALGDNFDGLVLVGSAALLVTTPGSDLDVVCFTRSPDDCLMIPKNSPRKALQRVHQELKELEDLNGDFRLDFLQDARVPILRVYLGCEENCTTVDILVDQKRPVDHLRWFEQVGAAPRPAAPAPYVTPLVTLTLRCVKWWLKQREIPRTKEGGLPTLVWLLLAVHSCSLSAPKQLLLLLGKSRTTMKEAYWRCWGFSGQCLDCGTKRITEVSGPLVG